jgi:hypothetical protein
MYKIKIIFVVPNSFPIIKTNHFKVNMVLNKWMLDFFIINLSLNTILSIIASYFGDSTMEREWEKGCVN